jgi:release factor glutamine methyltransferase
VTAATEPLFAEQRELLRQHWHPLADKPEESLVATLRALWLTASGVPSSVRRAATAEIFPLDDAQAERFRELVRRRLAGEPLAYLTGRQDFMGLELLCDPGALIPRVETELLAGVALEAVRARVDECGRATVVDACTGSGNVALAIAAHEPEARVYAADLSEAAVDIGRRNAERLGLAARVTFATGDLFAPFQAMGLRGLDVVTCNPPYISSGKVPQMAPEIARFEPSLAFDGGALGFDVIMRAIAEAPILLRPGGVLCMEVGAGQCAFVARRVARLGTYDDVRTVVDARGEPRVLAAVHRPAVR